MLEKILFFVVLLAISVISIFSTMPTMVLAANNTTDMDVNVSELSQITLFPLYLSWTGITTGTSGIYKNITLKNTGSVNVSDIYAYVDTLTDEDTRPYGSSNATKYAAGGVLTFENETETKYYYLGKIEWNWTEDIPSHDWGAVTSPAAWGYFRNLTSSYAWVAGNGTGGLCNNTSSQFAISDLADLGTVATRTPIEITTVARDANYAYYSVTGSSSPLYHYCVAVASNCGKIYIYNFDKRAGFTSCSESDYLYNGNLAPGGSVILHINPWIPWGTPAGDLNTATLTIATFA